MEPEPLTKKKMKRMEFELEEETKVALEEWERGYHETIIDLLFAHQRYISKKILNDVKSAVEWLLKEIDKEIKMCEDLANYFLYKELDEESSIQYSVKRDAFLRAKTLIKKAFEEVRK